MTLLDVPDARLYAELDGTGPLLVMVPGAAGVADIFRPLAQHLTSRYTVLRYDRRGFGRSRAAEPPDDRTRLRVDADDVRRLIEHAAPSGRATVFGSSSGAIVALAALVEHPAAVAAVVAHEPPLLQLLPDGEEWIDAFHQIYEVYRQEGVETAMTAFRHRTFPPADADAMARAPKHPGNAQFWFERELRQYPATTFDLDTLRSYPGRVLPAAGRASGAFPCRRASEALAVAVGHRLADLPGGHIGFLTDTATFADHVGELLTEAARSAGGAG